MTKKKLKKVEVEKLFKLNQFTRDERAKQAVLKAQEVAELREEYKGIQADWRKRLKEADAEREKISKAFLTGEEMRTVMAEEHYDADNQRVIWMFEGEKIGFRDLTEDEIREWTHEPMFEDENPEVTRSKDIAQVHREETSKKTKRSAV